MPRDFDPIDYINAPRWQESRLGLERITRLMELLGNPQERLRFVHVAGTNGKGSTCAYLASILQRAGYKTGLFTSPYIEVFNERIRVDGENISADDLLCATLSVRDAARIVEEETGEHPTEFELMTAVALVHFKRVACDIAVMEVGMGGRLDSTNIISPDACVITRIGMDHTEALGDTLGKIAVEKAGIIKAGAPVVTCAQDDASAMDAIAGACARNGCVLDIVQNADIEVGRIDGAGLRHFEYRADGFCTRLLGSYQPLNACMAIECARVLREIGWHVPEGAIHEGVRSAEWIGRFEVICRDPLFVVDGAHNVQGALALRESLDDLMAGTAGAAGTGAGAVGWSCGAADADDDGVSDAWRKLIFIAGVLADKDYKGMVDAVFAEPFADGIAVEVVTYAPAVPRALPSGELASVFADAMLGIEVTDAGTPEEAVEMALKLVSADDRRSLIAAFGSLYSIGAIRKMVGK